MQARGERLSEDGNAIAGSAPVELFLQQVDEVSGAAFHGPVSRRRRPMES